MSCGPSTHRASSAAKSLSLHPELRITLFVAVTLLIAGVGSLPKLHLDRIGPLGAIAGVTVAAGACYAAAARRRLRRAPGTVVRDYVPLRRALLHAVTE